MELELCCGALMCLGSACSCLKSRYWATTMRFSTFQHRFLSTNEIVMENKYKKATIASFSPSLPPHGRSKGSLSTCHMGLYTGEHWHSEMAVTPSATSPISIGGLRKVLMCSCLWSLEGTVTELHSECSSTSPCKVSGGFRKCGLKY